MLQGRAHDVNTERSSVAATGSEKKDSAGSTLATKMMMPVRLDCQVVPDTLLSCVPEVRAHIEVDRVSENSRGSWLSLQRALPRQTVNRVTEADT